MNPADGRRLAYERHRRFLANVTGWQFGPPSLALSGVVFHSPQTFRDAFGVHPMLVTSVIREREDLPNG